MNIVKSVAKYETWLRKQLHDDVFEGDFAEKHQKMADGAFQFLRGTYWRWAETFYDVCPELKGAPQVLAVGDIHVENFGTWRDADGRLVWGVNDFDEAAQMPYPIDLVRLAASALLAQVPGIKREAICHSILAGYRVGIENPQPFVLDRMHKALRRVAIVSDAQRKEFWAKFDPVQIEAKRKKAEAKHEVPPKRPKVRPVLAMRPRYRKALERAKPAAEVQFDYYERTAGTGSLGRRRYFGVGGWQGDLVVREAKAIVPSGWALAHRGARKLRCEEIACGRHRSPDPFYGLRGTVLVRRLSPNDFKIEVQEEEKRRKDKKDKAQKQQKPKPADKAAQDAHKAVGFAALVNADVLGAMGRDLAAIHRGTPDRRKAILADLDRRKHGWLLAAATRAAKNVEAEYRTWAVAYRKTETAVGTDDRG